LPLMYDSLAFQFHTAGGSKKTEQRYDKSTANVSWAHDYKQ